MSGVPQRIDFRGNVRAVPYQTRSLVQKATAKFLGTRASLVELLGPEYWQTLRQAGHDLRRHTLTHLDHYLELLEERLRHSGAQVHWARDAEEARRIVLSLAGKHKVKRAVKAKSMATEEIDLNHALQEAGIEAQETDLGEFIIQLAGVGPSHIIVPAVHLTKEGIADLFRKKLGVDAPPDAEKLAQIARTRLREEFLAADMGISGANFLVAETGTLVILSNEGNARMCTTLPPLHVAVVGIDKVVPDWESLTVLLKLLARSATGQKMTCYTSFIGGPPRIAAEQGPRELHVVLLDNGRSRILQDPVGRDTLLCIRCGVCLNVCPVYNNAGGLSYGWVYPGPIGAILSTQLLGTQIASDLPFASSLCGACDEYCSVMVPITEILLHLRTRVVEGDSTERSVTSPLLRLGAEVGARSLGTSWVYKLGTQVLRWAQAPLRRDGWIPALPPPLSRWTKSRPLPAFGADFRQWWRKRTREGRSEPQQEAKG